MTANKRRSSNQKSQSGISDLHQFRLKQNSYMTQTFSSDKKKGQDLDTPYMEKIVNDNYIQKSVLGKRIIDES